MTLQKPTLYLHIGTHKTGTSSIQMALHTHREELLKAGVLYPALNNAYNHRDLAVLLQSPEGMTKIQNWFEGILTRVNQQSISKVVISAEALYFLRMSELVRNRDGLRQSIITEENYREKLNKLRALIPDFFDIKVVVYLRRQDSLVESAYYQLVKVSGVFSGTIGEVIEDLSVYMDYSFILNLWAEIFGKENILVRVYEKQQLPGGSVQDFLRVIDMPTELSASILTSTDNYNTRLSRDILDYKLILNRLLAEEDPIRMEQLHYTMLEKLSEQPDFNHRNTDLLTATEKRAIIAKFAEINSKIAQDFLGRQDRSLFYEDLPKEEQLIDSNGLSVEMAVKIGMHLIFLILDGNQGSNIERTNQFWSYTPSEFDGRRFLNNPVIGFIQKIYNKVLHERDRLIIRRSGLFDSDFYLSTYSDVAASGMDPIKHFVCSGWKEARKPTNYFDVSSYVVEHPEVIRLGVNPFVHFIQKTRITDRK